MNGLSSHVVLLAQRSRVDSLASGFRSRRARLDSQDVVTVVLAVLGMVVVVWGISYLLRLRQQRLWRASPLRLFLSLGRAHRLRWSEQWLLWRLARAQRLRDPARLFLEPERFDAVELGPSLQARRAQLHEIRDRLFGRIEPEQEQTDPTRPAEAIGHSSDGTPRLPTSEQNGSPAARYTAATAGSETSGQ